MGLIAREIERRGISTMSFMLSREIADKVRAPRAICLKWPFGHPLGEPGNTVQQRRLIQDAFDLLGIAKEPVIAEPGYRWRRETYTDPWGGSARAQGAAQETP